MSTKDTILKIACALFNQHGTAHVTTNHIAKEAGISPGNLYYHYQDKADIIRAIYEQMISDWEVAYQRIEGRPLSPASLKRFTEDNFEFLWQYRFFHRENVALLQADPLLAERHTHVLPARYQRQRALIAQAVEVGLLRFPEPDVTLDDILTVIWIIANHYLVYLETMGQHVEQKDFAAGAELVLKVLRPYIPPNPGAGSKP